LIGVFVDVAEVEVVVVVVVLVVDEVLVVVPHQGQE
jgi:hypothetical protein